VRQLRPGAPLTAVALLTLILAIAPTRPHLQKRGLSAVLLRPLPYPAAGRLVVLWASAGDQDRNSSASRPPGMARPEPHFAGHGHRPHPELNYTGADRPDRMIGGFVTARPSACLGATRPRAGCSRTDETAEAAVRGGRALERGLAVPLRRRSAARSAERSC